MPANQFTCVEPDREAKQESSIGSANGDRPSRQAVVVIGSIDNILEPILIGHGSRMDELLVFFSMLGGIGVFGVMGFIVGPVIAALFLTLLDIYGKEFNKQLDLVHNRPFEAATKETCEI